MINMNDVAQKAEVSTATVSRVLNGKSSVSPEAMGKVLSACKELNYKLNFNIQDLVLKSRNGATRNIAFVLAGVNFSNPSYARLVDGISNAINKYHYHLTLVKLTGKEESIYDLPPVLRDERVDGILISGIIEPKTVALMKSLNAQCVVVGNYSAALLGSLSSVQANVALPIFETVGQLVKQGKKKIAFMGVPFGNYFIDEVFSGYKQALLLTGLSFDENICYTRKNFTETLEEIELLFHQEKQPFDAILCHEQSNAYILSHLLTKYFAKKLEIPITIATFYMSAYYEMPVPTVYVKLKLEECVETALELLIEQIEGKKSSRTIVV